MDGDVTNRDIARTLRNTTTAAPATMICLRLPKLAQTVPICCTLTSDSPTFCAARALFERLPLTIG